MTFLASWTLDRVTDLRRFWADGLSASQIAAELGGLTRNAVVGKLHRLGLKRNDTQIAGPRKPKAPPRPRRAHPRIMPTLVPADAPKPPPYPPRAGDPVLLAPNSRPVDIMGLTNETCRWPLWEDDAEPRLYCGALEADLVGGCPFCEFHTRAAANRRGGE